MAGRFTFAMIWTAVRSDKLARSGSCRAEEHVALLGRAARCRAGNAGRRYDATAAAPAHPNLWIKDEGLNPTGSFKARGMSTAVSMARHYGLKKLAAPRLETPAARWPLRGRGGIEAYIFMPKDVPLANRLEVEAAGRTSRWSTA